MNEKSGWSGCLDELNSVGTKFVDSLASPISLASPSERLSPDGEPQPRPYWHTGNGSGLLPGSDNHHVREGLFGGVCSMDRVGLGSDFPEKTGIFVFFYLKRVEGTGSLHEKSGTCRGIPVCTIREPSFQIRESFGVQSGIWTRPVLSPIKALKIECAHGIIGLGDVARMPNATEDDFTVEIAPQFQTHVEAALLRLQAVFPTCHFVRSSSNIVVSPCTGTSKDQLRRFVFHAIYREKIYAETLTMRQALVSAVTKQ